MTDKKCSVCGGNAKEYPNQLGKNFYCKEHYQKAKEDSNAKSIQLQWLRNYGFPLITITLVVIFGIISITLASSSGK